MTTLQPEQTRIFLAKHRIKCTFIPSNAQLRGEFCKRLIRRFKQSLQKLIGRRLLNEDEMHTLVSEVDGIMNNRPFTYIDEESDEPTSDWREAKD